MNLETHIICTRAVAARNWYIHYREINPHLCPVMDDLAERYSEDRYFLKCTANDHYPVSTGGRTGLPNGQLWYLPINQKCIV